MKDKVETKESPISELVAMHRRIAELEASEIQHERVEKVLRQAQAKLKRQVEELNTELAKAKEELRIEIFEHKQTKELANLLIVAGRRNIVAVRTSTDAISVASPVNGKLLFCNNAFLKRWKIKGDYHNLHHSDCFKVDPGSDVLMKAVQATMADGWSGELTGKAMNGQTFPIHVTTSSIVDKDGRIVGLLGIFKDLTERKRSEEALKLAYTELDQIFDATADAIRVIYKDFNILRVNEAFAALLGVSKDEAVGKKCYDVLCCPRCHSPNCPLTQILNGEERIEVEDERERSDGTRLSCIVTVTPFRQPDGKVIGIVSTIRDITKRKRAEEALRESEERFRDLLENANDLIQSVAPDGHFLYVNKAWRNILGYSEKEVANLTLWDIIHPDSISRCKEVFQRVMSGETVSNVEAVFVAKDGKLVPVEGNVNCRFEGGKPVATRGIFRDITERK